MLLYKNSNIPIEERVKDLLERMTLEEKVAQMDILRAADYSSKVNKENICAVDDDNEFDTQKLKSTYGDVSIGFACDFYTIPEVTNKLQRYFIEDTRLGIPAIFIAEALHGVLGTRGTIFPVPLSMAATFDTALINEVGKAIGNETRALGFHEILAPNLDVARDPRWGRVEETFGEDTFLCKEMGVAIIKGEQNNGDLSSDKGVITEPKHYVVHGMPEQGVNCSPARVGKREVLSSYLPVFEAAIKEAGAPNVMASYNCIDGDVMMCSHEYLTEILKEEFKAKGYVRSDWGGIWKIHNRHHLVSTDEEGLILAINNGLDVQGLDIPHEIFMKTIIKAVNESVIPIERINDAVSRVLRMKFTLGLFDRPYTDEENYKTLIRCKKHQELALETAQKAITLIKNKDILPLKHGYKSIALIGPSSDSQKLGGYSSTPQFKINSVYDELRLALGNNVRIAQCDGCAITKGSGAFHVDGQPHLERKGEKETEDMIETAVKIARESDIIVAVMGDNNVTSGELHDRCSLKLHGRQTELLKELHALNKPLILVLENGKPVDLLEEEPLCDAIIVSWFGGESGAKAIVNTLTGKNNPSGKLPISFPQDSFRIPCYYSMLPGGDAGYLEGEKEPKYPFGFGLSYTTFDYSNFEVKIIDKDEYIVEVKIDVKNTGDLEGDEIVQVYVEDIDSSVVTPNKLLKGFSRVNLKSSETKTISIILDSFAFSLINLKYEKVVEPGNFKIMIGSSSDDIRFSKIIRL